jgi:hypothetical protein
MGRFFNLLDEKQLAEAMAFGMLEHCSTVVGNSARKTVELILRQRNESEGSPPPASGSPPDRTVE